MKRLLSSVSLNTDVATLLLRLFFGGMFTYYGYGKVVNYEAYSAGFTDIIGIGAKLSFNLVIFGEFVCGIFILLGLFTRFAAIPAFITMVVAYFVAHGQDNFADKIPAFTYLILSVIVFIQGGGKYSLDALIFNKKQL